MRVASDIGGTFTDLVFFDEITGKTGTTKASTTPAAFEGGVADTVVKAEIDAAGISSFIHGSTVVINTLTERKGAKTGLITTKGFRDVLEITRGNRPDLYNMYYEKPKPFVPRRYRLEVRERTSSRGEVVEPLNAEDVKSAVTFFISEGIEAVAVCFLHSYAFPEHERQCGEIIRRTAPEMPVTLSCDITREWREYERTTTAVLNSYVQKKTAGYLDSLETSLHAFGVRGSFYIMQSNGGAATFTRGKTAPINMVESGPVGGVIGAAELGRLVDENNIISFDVGGTTAKTSLITEGRPKITTAYKIEWTETFAGYPILSPTVDIVEIGAGGGSVAWTDAGGTLRIGPKSAGAVPGPVCYGKGGTEPTVTDANVLAGRINPDYFLGGEIPLRPDLSEQAVRPLAKALGVGPEEAAMGIIRLADAHMVNAIKLISVRRGFDPRDFTMVAFGGGGAMHAAALARELRLKRVIIPENPGVFSAWGMLVSELRQDFIRTKILRPDETDPAEIEGIFREMEEKALKIMNEQGRNAGDVRFLRFADIRYAGQEHTIKTPLPEGTCGAAAVKQLEKTFRNRHNRSFSFTIDAPVELVNYHLTTLGKVSRPRIKECSPGKKSLQEAVKGERRVNFDELGYHRCPIYERGHLPVEMAARGPLVIEEPSSTTVVFPDQKVYRDEFGFLHISSPVLSAGEGKEQRV